MTHAQVLVADLVRKRELTNTTKRPIIFVAHSLGGIIVKSALIHSDAARPGALHEHRSVKVSTYGIIFLGTPHQGAKGAQLGRYSTWDTSYKHIKRQNPASANLLRLWAYFDKDDLWYELLRAGSSPDSAPSLQTMAENRLNFDHTMRGCIRERSKSKKEPWARTIRRLSIRSKTLESYTRIRVDWAMQSQCTSKQSPARRRLGGRTTHQHSTRYKT
ncbi:hypothetical protein B0J13DRAFT_569314 [Dactylonectria estremocensis]|uniref:DUF676 domain-containing protein n=1 Tax=Dactylonectria estremocensis TaxID=1079267 RepID=A0A9P9DHY1_9HYPO|nr:hypothetical protein B0J13DRAFT_569314 [Dactylonectria estremocensis]